MPRGQALPPNAARDDAPEVHDGVAAEPATRGLDCERGEGLGLQHLLVPLDRAAAGPSEVHGELQGADSSASDEAAVEAHGSTERHSFGGGTAPCSQSSELHVAVVQLGWHGIAAGGNTHMRVQPTHNEHCTCEALAVH
mgnify:CR=1 FL=1